jgi:Cytochrome P460
MRFSMRSGLIAGVAILFCVVGLMYVMAATPSSGGVPGIEYTADNKLKEPIGFRKWVYVGASVTPNDLNGGQALFPEFHSIYMDPESFAEYQKTGEYREGTVFVKELISVGAKEASSGKGYFMGDFLAVEVAIKDSSRFKNEPGSWAYFSFDGKAHQNESALHPTAACNKCHEEDAAEDFVFSQFYPVLTAAKPSSK